MSFSGQSIERFFNPDYIRSKWATYLHGVRYKYTFLWNIKMFQVLVEVQRRVD